MFRFIINLKGSFLAMNLLSTDDDNRIFVTRTTYKL